MKPPLRIAVLECDTPLDRTQQKYGSYGGVFEALLEAGADSLARDDLDSKTGLDITKWDVVNMELYPELDDVDAILLSGSRHNSFDNIPWILKLVDYVKRVLDQDRIRLIGVCFGHQIIGRALGVKVDRSQVGWEISVSNVQLSEKGKELFGKDELSIFQMHTDIVYDWPPGVEKLGSSDRCEVQGMYQKGSLITVQGHPEFTQQIVTELLESRHASGVFDDALFKSGMERVGNKHDGVAVGAAFLKFVLEE
ncbi:class I glutamine amidotransferase-like protein [Aulographum hederae CBS 113979]|uniref:Class I glutamine amidotransferase-like protein n=1 Tax=Aulographum hederae CBS 113979 TaxID=1176131 RepID=A0A6G1H8A9_9PEZI|nr:class I glutamine amidotransferase-like protein [Aulographum hederae CBS 113979]